jgi:hypothetical protein
MPILRTILRPFDPAFRAARERAMDHLRGAHAGWRVTNALLRAEEPERHVFAVFYADDGPLRVPGRYRLVAVSRLNGTAEELPLSPDSPYWIRGYK